MLTIRKNGKIILEAADNPYTPVFSIESKKPNTLYVNNQKTERGLIDEW